MPWRNVLHSFVGSDRRYIRVRYARGDLKSGCFLLKCLFFCPDARHDMGRRNETLNED